MMNQTAVTPVADKAAISLSLVCVFHCLALPVLVSLFPSAMLAMLQDETVHFVLLTFVIPISVFSLTLGCHQHKKMPVVGLGLTGLSLLLFSALFADAWGGETMELIGTLLGSSIVACSHVLNFKLCRSSRTCGAHHDC